MLQVTDTAAAVLREAREAQDLPDSFGVRISGQPTPTGEMTVALAFSEGPGDNDQVTEQEGTQVFVAPEVAEPLSEAVIDVEDTAEGPQLSIRVQ
jgi:Fe-S cluster assembly iron-binding protein IscA